MPNTTITPIRPKAGRKNTAPNTGISIPYLRPKGMPKSVKPAKVPDHKKPEGDNDELTHFVGISMDRAGFPIRLFTTNRWVTGETWYKAPSVISLLDRFDMDLAYTSLPVNIWITAMLQLFRSDIEALLKARDQAVRDWQAKHPDETVYEDRGLEITSTQDISVEKQIKGVQRALKAA